APGPQTGAARAVGSKNLRGKHPVKQNAIRMQGRAEAARSRTQFCRTACSRRAEQPAPRKDGRALEPGSAPGPENPAPGQTI
ncbi:hypothetical protein, partial [Sphingobacterium thalpophilum]|uniref:hypothetical protein n=1 Tax=Sphingobacterium thalpophilum TaxID=259 RepID=UPI003C767FF3